MAQDKILVVEDDDNWREKIFRKKLEEKGYQVLAISERAALQEYLYPGAFGLAIVDIGLSPKDYTNRDGMAVIADIARLDPAIPIIVVSGRAAEGMKKDASEFHRTVAFFEKETFNATQFLTTVEHALKA